MLEVEALETGDTKLIKEFEHESQQPKTATSLEIISAPPPRESLITTAINFLQNDRIRKSPINQKHKFLRSKGLTDTEIQIACERAGVFSQDPNSTVIEMENTQQAGYLMVPRRQSMLGKFKDVLHSMALVSGVAYACYLFYKKFIEPFLFGRKKKTVEEHLVALEDKLEKTICDLNKEIIIVKEAVVSTSHNDDVSQKLHSFKNDLDAIKGLLLNRKQFASPLTTTAVPPSIPAWQLASARHTDLKNDDSDKNDDAGSAGSGSSETEVVTKNSDSSLEIIKSKLKNANFKSSMLKKPVSNEIFSKHQADFPIKISKKVKFPIE